MSAVNGYSLPAMAHALGGEVRGEQILCPGPGHSPEDRSLAVRLDPQAPDGFVVHSFAEGDDSFTKHRDHVRERLGLGAWPGSEKVRAQKTIKATYDYVDEAGELLFQAVRFDPKDFRQRQPDGRGGWVWNIGGVRAVPYRLPAVIEAVAAGTPIFVVEGEKDVDSLTKLGLVATCNSGGAGKWRAEHAEFLRGAEVVIVPDNDDPGRTHSEKVAVTLRGLAKGVRILALPDLPEKGDVSDWLVMGGTIEMLRALVDEAPVWQPAKEKSSRRGSRWRDAAITAKELQAQRFPPTSWIVPGLIPEGLTLLAGKPKIGKSWAGLDLCLGVAGGTTVMGHLQPETGDVLYCALEDNHRRLQKRIARLLSSTNEPWPERLNLATTWPRLDQGGADEIADWAKSVSKPRLVVLDTLAGVRPLRATNGYAEDYEALGKVHRLANDLGIGIVVLHHTRKLIADDPVDTISGTLGLSGCADTVLVLNRGAKGTTLYGRGRDVEEFEHAVEFSKETCRWRLLGNAADVGRSDTRKAILAAMGRLGETTTPKDIAAEIGIDANTVHQRLRQMVHDGEVIKVGRGEYRLPEGAPP